MKYTYAYKTSDGVRYEASMNAASRDEVFVALRKQGIKAIKVVAADGSKANGEIHGVRKRVVAALVAFVALGVGIVAYFSGTRSGGDLGGSVATAFATGQDRRQVIGDAAIIEKARATMPESDFMTYWEKRNDELRNLGIKTIGLSDE